MSGKKESIKDATLAINQLKKPILRNIFKMSLKSKLVSPLYLDHANFMKLI